MITGIFGIDLGKKNSAQIFRFWQGSQKREKQNNQNQSQIKEGFFEKSLEIRFFKAILKFSENFRQFRSVFNLQNPSG